MEIAGQRKSLIQKQKSRNTRMTSWAGQNLLRPAQRILTYAVLTFDPKHCRTHRIAGSAQSYA